MTEYTFFPSFVQVALMLCQYVALFAVVEIISLQFLHRAETFTEAKLPSAGIFHSHTVSASFSTACPIAEMLVRAFSTLLHTLQWLPSVKPFLVQVGATAASITSL